MAWTFDQPNSLVFRNNDVAEVLAVSANTPGDPGSEWTATLTKSGAPKGAITLESLAALKAMFTQVGADL